VETRNESPWGQSLMQAREFGSIDFGNDRPTGSVLQTVN